VGGNVAKTYLTSFATPEFELSLRELLASGRQFGIDHVRPWYPHTLRQTDFYRQNRFVLDQPRGAGFWLWKPYIIQRLLEEISVGDMLIYSDAAITVIGSLTPLFDLCVSAGGVLVFAGHYDGIGGRPNICRVWTKRDCFVLMGCDNESYYSAPMLDAAFIVLSKTAKAETLVREWLEYCKQPAILTDGPNVHGRENLPGFLAHRHDQSVLSLLAVRHGLPLFRSPSQFGNHFKAEAQREPTNGRGNPTARVDCIPNRNIARFCFTIARGPCRDTRAARSRMRSLS
jgi:hypothetical protein